MILRLILKNFLSFDDEAQFDMFPNLKRTQLANHVYTGLCDVPLLKQAAIYGSNGAGKSNVVKAMEFLRAFALDKDFAKNLKLASSIICSRRMQAKSLFHWRWNLNYRTVSSFTKWK